MKYLLVRDNDLRIVELEDANNLSESGEQIYSLTEYKGNHLFKTHKPNMFGIKTYKELFDSFLDIVSFNKDIIDMNKYISLMVPAFQKAENNVLYGERNIFNNIEDEDFNEDSYKEFMKHAVFPYFINTGLRNKILGSSGRVQEILNLTIYSDEDENDHGDKDTYIGIVQIRLGNLAFTYANIIKILNRNIHNELVDARESLQGRFQYGFNLITQRIIQNYNLSQVVCNDAACFIGTF
jgi:hypothetical protein